jgi:hypothetical protein
MTQTSPPIPPLPLPPRPRRSLTALAAILIFIAGTVCGGGVTWVVAVRHIRHAMQHPEEAPARITSFLRRRLDLSPEQSTQIERLVAEHQTHLQAIRRDTEPRIHHEMESLKQDIAQVLTPEQQLKWDRIFQEAIENWLPPPPPPPPHGPPPPER